MKCFDNTIHKIEYLSILSPQSIHPRLSNFYGNIDCIDCLELWKPKEDEWCVFWNEGMKSYRLAQFKQIGNGKGKENTYKDKQGNYYDFITPLEFVQTLKDK